MEKISTEFLNDPCPIVMNFQKYSKRCPMNAFKWIFTMDKKV